MRPGHFVVAACKATSGLETRGSSCSAANTVKMVAALKAGSRGFKEVMSVRRVSFCLVLAMLALAGFAGVAGAGKFSLPVRLPGSGESEWRFAVNDRGQAVAVRFGGTAHGHNQLLVFAITRSGRLARPARLEVPGIPIYPSAPTVTLDDRGRLAVAIDVEEHAANGPHSFGSGEHVAIASWRLGEHPGAFQLLTPQGDEVEYSEGALSRPEIVVGPRSITALWSAGRGPLAEATATIKVDSAFGTFGRPLKAVNLATAAAAGSVTTHLALARGGEPVASWVDSHGHLASVKGSLTGALPAPKQIQTIPRFGSSGGFASDAEGYTALIYWTALSELFETNVMLRSSRDGGPLGHPRLLGSTRTYQFYEASVWAGAGQSVLALWQYTGRGLEAAEGLRLRTGTLYGPLAAQQQITPIPSRATAAFIGPGAQATLVYDGRETAGVQALTVSPHGHAGPASSLSGDLKECRLAESYSQNEVVATSPNGTSLFALECAKERSYLIRYTPQQPSTALGDSRAGRSPLCASSAWRRSRRTRGARSAP